MASILFSYLLGIWKANILHSIVKLVDVHAQAQQSEGYVYFKFFYKKTKMFPRFFMYRYFHIYVQW